MTAVPDVPAQGALPEAPGAESAEAELVHAVRRGETEAFAGIVRMHGQRVHNFIYQMTRQSQDAEDLAQQTFIKAYKSLHRFDTDRPLINWLLTIARRTALNHFRSAKHWEEIPEETAHPAPTPARDAEAQDQIDNLWDRARRDLSEREYTVMWLRFAEERSIEEIARIAQLTKTNVKVLIFRARRRLTKGMSLS